RIEEAEIVLQDEAKLGVGVEEGAEGAAVRGVNRDFGVGQRALGVAAVERWRIEPPYGRRVRRVAVDEVESPADRVELRRGGSAPLPAIGHRNHERYKGLENRRGPPCREARDTQNSGAIKSAGVVFCAGTNGQRCTSATRMIP